jgi:hypothetical protein
MVVVRVHDAALRGDGLGHGVGGAGRGQAGADVQELADPALPGEVAHGAGEEGPVGACPGDYLRAAAGDLLGGVTVRRKMIFPSDPYVVDPGRMRDVGIEPARPRIGGLAPG